MSKSENNGYITVKGARENNLKNLSVNIPRNKMVVLTGISGSGKTTLAFDTIFAEGQRRYVESLSSYARQFLGLMNKPDVDSIEGLSPAISIDQKTTSNNPRSTVGTVTEIYDYLRLLYARIGDVHCPNCGKRIERQTIDVIVDRILSIPENTKILVEAPVVRGRKGEYRQLFEDFKKSGYVRVNVDGEIKTLDEDIDLDKQKKHSISVVVDRLVIKSGVAKRLTDSVETALTLANGLVVIDKGDEKLLFSDKYACSECGTSVEEIEPRLFSFNSPFGACPDCSGLGYRLVLDPDLIVKDGNKNLADGALSISGWNFDNSRIANTYFNALAKRYGFSIYTPYKDLPDSVKRILLYGNDGEKLTMNYSGRTFSGSMHSSYEGVIPNLMRRYHESKSDYVKSEIEKYMTELPCDTCHGHRLKKEALSVLIGGKNIHEITNYSIDGLLDFFGNLRLTDTQKIIADRIIREIVSRLDFLKNVGLSYLTLSRSAGSLSGGEAQRIRLATQIGSGLVGVLYILDEPSIGLHQRDNGRLITAMKNMRDLGNTLIVVEHDEETIRSADHIIDVGVGAGIHGGRLVAQGTVEDIEACPESLTGDYLAGRRAIAVPLVRRVSDGRYITVKGASQNNLRGIDVSFPIGLITAVTGVSGSGKSSLVNEILYPYLATKLNRAKMSLGKCDAILGIEHVDKVIAIDQTPIGRTPRSNPATYCGVFTPIRELFAATADSRERGYKAGRFSFNVSGGRCEHCSGDGIIKIEMHFLPDVYVPCEVCKGKRYTREILDVKYKGKNIADVLDMTVDEATDFFENIPSIYNKIKSLKDVGLGYVKLGQSSTTLSGGEAQRVKLATELSKRSTGRTVYILDEPTMGLHVYDVDRLVGILQRLCEGGNTIIVIEHNLDVIKVCDHVVDLGPEGGSGGGNVISVGSPEEVAEHSESFTGQYLKTVLRH